MSIASEREMHDIQIPILSTLVTSENGETSTLLPHWIHAHAWVKPPVDSETIPC